MCDLFSGGYDEAANIQAQAAQKAAGEREAQTQKGLTQYTDTFLPQAAGYLDPYAQSGQAGLNYLNQQFGTPEQQGQALATYQGSPQYNLLQAAREDAVRRSQGSAAAGPTGLRSGAQIESLGRRLSDMDLQDFYKYQNTAQGLAGLGAGASGQAANLYNTAGQNVLRTYGNIGDIQGTGTIGAGNARAQGAIAGQNSTNQLINAGLQAAGTIAGGALGGPMGASLGSSLGGALGPGQATYTPSAFQSAQNSYLPWRPQQT